MVRITKHLVLVLLVLPFAVAIIVGVRLFARVEVDRLDGPSGDYVAIISERRYQSYLMRAPGDSGGAPGFVEIFNRAGESFGRIPIPLTQMGREIQFTSTGAEIRAVAEWDFKHRTCYYWTEDQDKQVWVRR